MGNWFGSLSVAYRFIRKKRLKEANIEASGEEKGIIERTAKGLDEGDIFGALSSDSASSPLPKQVSQQADADQIGVARSVSRKVPLPMDSTRRPPIARTNYPTASISLTESPTPPLPGRPHSSQSVPCSDAVQPSYPPAAFKGLQSPPEPESPITYEPSPSPPQFVVTTEMSTTGLQQSTRLSTVSSISYTGLQRSSTIGVARHDDQRTVSSLSSPDQDVTLPVSPSSFPVVPTGNRRNGIFYSPTPPSPPHSRGSDDQPLLNPSRKEQGIESSRTSVGEWATETFLDVEQSIHSREGSISASSVYSTDLTHRNRGERLSSAPWTSRPSSAGVDTGLVPPGSQRQSNASLAPSGYSHSHLSSQFGELYDAYYRHSRQSIQSKMEEADDHNAPVVENETPKNPRTLTLAKYTIVEVPSPLPSPMIPA